MLHVFIFFLLRLSGKNCQLYIQDARKNNTKYFINKYVPEKYSKHSSKLSF